MALSDITNKKNLNLDPHQKVVKKRLSDGSEKLYSYNKCRKHFEITFHSVEEKEEFEKKWTCLKTVFNGNTSKLLINLVDNFMDNQIHQSAKQEGDICCTSESQSEDLNSKYTDETLFFGDVKAAASFHVQIEAHTLLCRNKLLISNVDKIGHVLSLHYVCAAGHTLVWNSSLPLSSNFLVNYKVLTSYMCSGMLTSEYERFCDFAECGILSKHFRSNAMVTFAAAVDVEKTASIATAREEELAASRELGDEGIRLMTDARHACRKNSYHCDHVALGLNTHKIVDYQHVTKEDDRSSQKHELIGCRRMYESLDAAQIKVLEHAHDRNMSVNKHVKSRPLTQNSNDRWHVAKPLTKGFKMISQGPKKTMGKVWHPELSGKGSLVKNHIYWAMDVCEKSPDKLKRLISSMIPHFQNNHSQCHEDSTCRQPDYVPEWSILTDPVAIDLFTKYVHSLLVYTQPNDYIYGRDTFYIESFNNTVLMYLDKRVHYGIPTYQLRINLAILQWNEHVDRPCTSISVPRLSVDHDRRQTGRKNYSRKTFKFVKDIWQHLKEYLDKGVAGHTDAFEEEDMSEDDSD